MLHTTMLKGFMDGSLGSRTAAMNAPYSDDPGNSGIPRYTQDKLNAMAMERAKAGFQLGFHAIGDRAVEMALDALLRRKRHSQPALPPRRRTVRGETGHETPPHNLRYRIEHSQVVNARGLCALQAAGRDCVDAAESSADGYGVGRSSGWGRSARSMRTRGSRFWMRACRWRLGRIIRWSRSRRFAASIAAVTREE